ncbi:hypothetical protein AX16_000998 [Volvariella volvacea WC 439]|nr:hypothetical protein AX16_000998 [Volvariella volvacea WC 439]
MESAQETYIMLLLADSNLPTGAFVASSGLESYLTHGFGTASPHPTLAFVQDSLPSYSRTTLPFVSDAHRVVSEYSGFLGTGSQSQLETTMKKLAELDELYDTMTLNHVAKRASKAQGVALLTLFSKGFSCPSVMQGLVDAEAHERESMFRELIDKYKLTVRRGDVPGHLPVCWGVITAALGLSLGAVTGMLQAHD